MKNLWDRLKEKKVPFELRVVGISFYENIIVNFKNTNGWLNVGSYLTEPKIHKFKHKISIIISLRFYIQQNNSSWFNKIQNEQHDINNILNNIHNIVK
jgi:hypothetical protein